jgi:tetratricopeptide (TPR) repeat protein
VIVPTTNLTNFVDTRKPLARAILFLLVVLNFLFAWLSVKWQLGNMLAENTSPVKPEAEIVAEYAVWLAPDDPLSNWILASSKSRSLSSETEQSLEVFKNVVRLAPYDFRWWLEFGSALEENNKIELAEIALKKAVSLAPSYAYPGWRLGNFYLRRGNVEKAIAEFQQASKHNTIYRQQIFSVLWNYFDQNPEILIKTVEDNPSAMADLAVFFAAKSRPNESLQVWQKLTPDERNRREPIAKVLAQGLFDKKHFRSSLEFSKQIGLDTEADIGKMQNGGFELPIDRESKAYFDWKVVPVEKTDVRLDATQKHSGKRSLRIQFNGYSALQYYHVYQTVVIQPAKKYRLAFWYRADKLKSAGPPLIEILNASDYKLIKSSKPIEDSTEWQKKEVEFITPEDTEAIVIRVGRVVCGSQCPLFGTIWLDDFELTEIH